MTLSSLGEKQLESEPQLRLPLKPPATLTIVAIAGIHFHALTIDRIIISSHELVGESPFSLGWLLTKSNRGKAISPKRYSVGRIPVAVGGTIIAITIIGVVAISSPTIAAS
jgi:hypothetical protein